VSHLTDELVNQVTWKIPNALVLVGSRWGEDWNAMTASWVTQVSMEPVRIGIAIDKEAVTHHLIERGGAFSINLWNPEDTKVFVKFSKPAAKQDSKLNGRAFRVGRRGMPIFEEAIAWLECSVWKALDCGTHTLFIGDLVDCGLQGPETRAAAISDTRMKYGGAKRH